MALHDTAKVAGVTEACRYNDHSMCNNPSCSCTCHQPEVNPNIPKVDANGDKPEKACPKCGSKRPATETYCRIDGERLASLLCGVCGAGMNPEDNYCYGCGVPKGTTKVTKAPQLVVPSNDIEYEQQVLKG